MSRLPVALLILALLAAGCARPAPKSANPSPGPATTAQPSPRATRSAAPKATPTASPAATPAPVSATTPPPAALHSALRAPAPTDPPPRIIHISLSERVVHSGDTVYEHVLASPNTASIEARIGGYSTSLPKTGVGQFSGSYKVPWLPFFIHGGFDIVVIARNTEGVQSRRTVRISVQ